MVIVPFMFVWMLQWYLYVPGALNVSAAVFPDAIVFVVHVPSSRVAVWPTLSPLVQPITSPTLAVTGSGENAKFLIEAWAVGAAPAAAGAHAAAAPPPPAAD